MLMVPVKVIHLVLHAWTQVAFMKLGGVVSSLFGSILWIFWFQACGWRETWIMMKSSPHPPPKKSKPECKYLGKSGKVEQVHFFKTRLQKRCCSLAPPQKNPLERLSLEESYANRSMIFSARPHASKHVPVDQEKRPRYTTLAQTVPDKLIYTTIPWWH